MKATLRSTVAAAMLLVPVAATFVAQPAAAQQQRALGVTSMALNADAGLSPGSTLRIQLYGSPSARSASVALGGTDVRVPLREQSPGNYTGSYVVSRADRIDPTQLMTARISDGSQTLSRNFSYPPAFQALAMGNNAGDSRAERREERREERQERREARNDRSAPQITGMSPAHGERISERGRAHVIAKLSDEGSGIDPSSVRLRLAGRDVTADTRVTADEINYRADLEPGRYTAELAVRDHAGNMTSKQWTFDVLDRERDRVSSGPLPLSVTSHGNGAALGANNVLVGRTAPNANVRVQVDSILQVPGMLGVSQQVMDQVVRADGNGNFSVPLNQGSSVFPGNRFEVRLTATSGTQTAEERLTLHRG